MFKMRKILIKSIITRIQIVQLSITVFHVSLTELNIQEVDLAVVYVEAPPVEDPVHGVRQSRLPVQSPGQVPLIVTLPLVSPTASLPGTVDVPERLPPGPNPGGSLHHDVGPSHPHVELVILQSPAPVLVAHTVDLLVVGPGDEQYAPDEGWVVVLWVELIRGDVIGSRLRELVGEGGVLGEKVHVMHGNIVTGRVRLSEANIDQIGSVKPKDKEYEIHVIVIRDQVIITSDCPLGLICIFRGPHSDC